MAAGRRARPRTWLRWLALGTAIGSLAWLLPKVFFKTNDPEIFYVLAYTRNTGPDVWPDSGVADPAPKLKNLSDYAVQIAVGCKIKAWKISTNQNQTTDTDFSAWLRISADHIDDRAFNCLSHAVRPPYVRLERGSEAALRSQNDFGEWWNDK